MRDISILISNEIDKIVLEKNTNNLSSEQANKIVYRELKKKGFKIIEISDENEETVYDTSKKTTGNKINSETYEYKYDNNMKSSNDDRKETTEIGLVEVKKRIKRDGDNK